MTTMMQVRMVDLRLLVPSPTNPRKHFSEEAIAELVLSLAQHGVKTPLSVRAWPEGRPVPIEYAGVPEGEMFFEIVAGERRYRAAKGADLGQVPCIVQEMTDAEVLELQLIENLQRVDLEPLDEAGGYAQMLELRGPDGLPIYTPETVAEKIGKSVNHVYERLRLLRLPASARKAMHEGVLPARQGVLIAQQPTEQLREALAQAILQPEDGSEPPLTVRAAVELVRDRFMVSLRGAPWKLDDADLLASAGACSVCPHRTGNMKELEGSLSVGGGGEVRGKAVGTEANVCVNPICFRAKQDAYWERAVAQAEKTGEKVLPDNEAQKHFAHDGELQYYSCYVEAKDKPESHELKDGVKRPPTWEKIATEGETKAPIVLARDRAGRVHRLVDRTLALTAAKENKLGILREESARSSQDETRMAEERKRKKALETQRLAMDLAMERMTASPCLRLMTAELIGLLTGRLVWETASDLVWSVVKRRSLGGTIHESRTVLAKAADKMSMEDQTALMAELLFFQTYSTHSTMAFGKEVKRLAEFCGVDLAECKTAAAEQLLQRKANRGKKAPAPWIMPAESSEKIFAAWLAKEKAELAATPASRAKARGDDGVRADFVLWLSLQKAKAGTKRRGVAPGKVQAHAETNGIEPGNGTQFQPFEWNEHGVCTNPQTITVKFSSAISKKWAVAFCLASWGGKWGFGYDLRRKGHVPDGATLGTSTAVSTDDCTRSYADALQDAKTLIMAWLTECKAPGAVTLAVDECFEPLLEVKVETNSRVLDSLWTAGVGSQEFADALEVASDADLEYVTKGLPMSHERTCAIDEEIAARTVKKKTTEPTPTGKLSKEARAQIIAAQKARWAKVKATKKKK